MIMEQAEVLQDSGVLTFPIVEGAHRFEK